MKSGRKRQLLTDKESEIMRMLWSYGPMFVRDMLKLYPDPKPHFNTVSTTVRILEDKGYVAHEAVGASFKYYAVVDVSQFRERSLADVVRGFFGNSYKSVVSSLVEDEKITVDELKEIIDMVERSREEK